MEEEIQEKLEDVYNLNIDVKFVDFRLYNIYVKIDNERQISFDFLYDGHNTLEANLTNIKLKIDNELINLFKKEGKK